MRAVHDHFEQLTTSAIIGEVGSGACGPTRSTWQPSTSSTTRKSCAILQSTAQMISSLSLQAGGPCFGVLPALDEALCNALTTAITRYLTHITMIIEACTYLRKALTSSGGGGSGGGAGAITPASSSSSSLPPTLLSAASDGGLPIVCLSSLSRLRQVIESLSSGQRPNNVGGSPHLPTLVWSHAACAPKFADMVTSLQEGEKRIVSLICDMGMSLAITGPLDACAANSQFGAVKEGSNFWGAPKRWRRGDSSSNQLVNTILQLHTLRAHLGCLGDPERNDLIYVRTVRMAVTKLLKAYWCDAKPSEGRSDTYMHDIKLLLALTLTESSGSGGGGEESPSDAAFASAASASAAASAGVGPPLVEDGTLAVERNRLHSLSLWLLSLLALHHAPLPLVTSLLRTPPPSSPAPGAAESDVEMAAQIGLELLPLSSQAATTALNSLKISTLATPRDQPTKFNHGAFRQRSPLEASSDAILTAAATKLPTGAAEAAAVAAVAKPKRPLSPHPPSPLPPLSQQLLQARLRTTRRHRARLIGRPSSLGGLPLRSFPHSSSMR